MQEEVEGFHLAVVLKVVVVVEVYSQNVPACAAAAVVVAGRMRTAAADCICRHCRCCFETACCHEVLPALKHHCRYGGAGVAAAEVAHVNMMDEGDPHMLVGMFRQVEDAVLDTVSCCTAVVAAVQTQGVCRRRQETCGCTVEPPADWQPLRSRGAAAPLPFLLFECAV